MAEESKLALNHALLKDTKLLYRDEQVEQIILSMKNGINAYVYGPVGAGKTTAVKNAINEFNDAKNKALYINCSTNKTVHAILKELINAMNEHLVSSAISIMIRSNADIVKDLKGWLRKFERTQFKVVVLDDFRSVEEPEIVENLFELGFTVILVSDDAKSIARLSPLAQSYFGYTIHFPDYTQEQTEKILKTIANRLIGEGRYTDSLINRIIQLCNGNIRYAENLLTVSKVEAIRLKKGVVDETDVPEPRTTGRELTYDEKLVMGILQEQHSVQGGELYRAYCEKTKFPKAERTFTNYMRALCEKNLVKAIGSKKGRVYEIVEMGRRRE